jgi:hypothetical protein
VPPAAFAWSAGSRLFTKRNEPAAKRICHILDLMSAWRLTFAHHSHKPAKVNLDLLNADEMRDNPQLSDFMVEPNKTPYLAL